jgi:hypothetical protein
MIEVRPIKRTLSDQAVDPEWKPFLRAGGIVTILLGVLFIAAGAISGPAISLAFAPTTQATLRALNSNALSWEAIWIIGGVADVLLLVIFTAFYFALRRANPGLTTIGLIMTIISVAVDLATEIPMRLVVVGLGSSYASASSEAQQAAYLATAEMAQNASNATGTISTFLLSAATILMGYAMLRSSTFRRATAYLGILSGILTLPAIPLIPGASGGILLLGYGVYAAGSLAYIAWVFLGGYRLYRLGSATSKSDP